MTRVDRALGAIAAVTAGAAIVWASNVPLTPHAASGAVLRLSWRSRPELIETCRPQSEEALEKLPAHMRQALVCDGITASYRLEVRRTGIIVADQIVRGGGLRHDRPLYVFREIPMPLGDSSISVRFTRVEVRSSDVDSSDLLGPPAGGADAPDGSRAMSADSRRREDENRRRQRAETVPAALSLDADFHFTRGTVILVTYDPEGRRLLTRRTGVERH